MEEGTGEGGGADEGTGGGGGIEMPAIGLMSDSVISSTKVSSIIGWVGAGGGTAGVDTRTGGVGGFGADGLALALGGIGGADGMGVLALGGIGGVGEEDLGTGGGALFFRTTSGGVGGGFDTVVAELRSAGGVSGGFGISSNSRSSSVLSSSSIP